MTNKKIIPYFLKNYTPSNYCIDHLDLTLDILEKSVRVRAKSQIRKNPLSLSQDSTLVLNGRSMRLHRVEIKGDEAETGAKAVSTKNAAKYILEKEKLILLEVPDKFELIIETEIDPYHNTSLSGLFALGNLLCTQCEAENFSLITYFLDRPDSLTRFTTTIIADKIKYPILLSNGNLMSVQDLPNQRHQVIWEDPHPKSCYLFALVAGDLSYIEDSYLTRSNRKVILRIFASPKELYKCQFAMQALKQAMQFDEERYGCEYDLDLFMIVAAPDFNFGAMENKGLNIFNSKCLFADPLTATDLDYQRVAEVVAHEYFHNWTGNRITCRDWFQLSLKEGITTYRENEFSQVMHAAGAVRIGQIEHLRTIQFPEDAGPLAHPPRPQSYIEIDNFYTSTIYEKGAEIIHVLKNYLGEEVFLEGFRQYCKICDGRAVTWEDFMAIMEGQSGKSLAQFARWYDQAGTPELIFKGAYDANKKTYTLTIKQGASKAFPPRIIPISTALFCDRNMVAERWLVLAAEEQSFEFSDVPIQPIPSFMRGFSAPVKWQYNYTEAELLFLMQHESDAFSRWEAAQQYTSRYLLKAIKNKQGNIGLMVEEINPYFDALQAILHEDKTDAALRAKLLTLPSELSLAAQTQGTVYPERIYHARENLQHQIATAFSYYFQHYYDTLNEETPYQFNPHASSRRSLKNILLHYLTLLNGEDDRERCVLQYQRADNLTDKLAALHALNDINCPERDNLLAEFYHTYQNEPLVLDQWFALQAQSRLEGTLDKIEELTRHPHFNFHHANRVRALIRGFSTQNPVIFHHSSGKGYSLLANSILNIDPFNPYLAAQLLTPLTQWQNYDANRQFQMREQLNRLLSFPTLSKNVYEQASKSLCE